MPGIYVNDGGQTSSALGNILGGIATAVGPKAAAEAALTYQQTGQADVARQQGLDILLARRAAQAAAPDFLTTLNANPGGGSSPVADTAASLAQPPTFTPLSTTSSVDTSRFSPIAKMANARIAQGDFSPAEQAGEVNLGQSATMGPGNTYEAIGKRATMPLSPGQVIHTSGKPDAGGAMGGGSVYTQRGEEAGATADDALAAKDLETGADSKATIGRADLIDQLYSRLDQLGSNNPADITRDLAVTALSQKLGVDLTRFSDVSAMKNEIRTLGLGLTGSLRTTQGDPMPRGSLEAIQAMAADPNTPPEQFHRMVAVIKNVAQGQADNFDAAVKFRTDRPKLGDQAGIDFHTQRGKNAAAQGRALSSLGGGGGGGGGGRIHVFADENSLNAAIGAGDVHEGDDVQIGFGPKAQVGKVGQKK